MLQLSRNTVRRILRTPEACEHAREPAKAPAPEQLQTLFSRARGNVVRVQQLLAAEHGQQVGYSTLTRWVRAALLREPPQRAGEYVLGPGL